MHCMLCYRFSEGKSDSRDVPTFHPGSSDMETLNMLRAAIHLSVFVQRGNFEAAVNFIHCQMCRIVQIRACPQADKNREKRHFRALKSCLSHQLFDLIRGLHVLANTDALYCMNASTHDL